MPRTTVDVDLDALTSAKRALGTDGLSATINAALHMAGRRLALADFDVIRDIDGTPEQVDAGRAPRAEALEH